MNLTQSTSKNVVFLGIDWADRCHAFHLLAPEGELHGTFQQSPSCIEAAVSGWKSQGPGVTLAIAIEQSRGPLISALLEYEGLLIYPVNPAALASYRKAFAHGGGKNDPCDARLLAQYLEHYHQQLRPLKQNSPLTRELTALVENRRGLVDQRASLANELRAVLKLYFPAILELKPAQMYADYVLRLLLACPTLQDVRESSETALREYLRGGTARRIQQRIDTLKTAMPLTEDQVLVRTSAKRVTSLSRRLGLLNQLIDEYDSDIARLVPQHDDYQIVSSLPATSETTQARLIAALGDDRSRYKDANALQAAAGIAPLRIQSGRLSLVSARWASSTFLKQTFHEYAGLSIRHSRWARAYYQLQRKRGKTAQMAIRALAFKWLRIIYRCWQDRVPYCEEHYIQRLIKSGSPIGELIKKAENLPEAT